VTASEHQRAEGREERKVVTVLFTDLVGFTGRSEELDPEDVRAMLTPYYALLREQIERRGGTVEKFIGDAVMAVFGAPVAHEDDPVRAVLAALGIRDAISASSPELQIRTAVHTGEALVALDANPSAGESMASGDVVNTAARLQAAAPVDGILVGEATYRATRHVIEYLEAGPVEAKGKANPIPVWQVVATRPRYGTDVEESARSPLVGRSRELALLTDAFARCRSEETAQLVTLVGVPGIGKSRLVAELFAVLDADADVYWWRQGRSLPYGESRSVWALGEIVKAQAGILESDDGPTAEEKLTAMVEEVLPDPEERRWVVSHLRTLAGVAGEADESGDRRVEAFSAWRRFFEALAEERPLILIFEDLHWADDTLLEFVDYLAEWVTGVPMLVVGTARPELLERSPGWGGGKRNATTLSIGALSSEDTARLLASLLDQMLLPAEAQAEVLRRSEGNPLYTGEYVRMLQDRGFLVRDAQGWRLERAENLPLPETVQGMIAARLDALSPPEKSLIQDAAVLGKVFWPSALGSADEAALHALERKEFIRRDRRSSVAGEAQYAFLHLLVRDVAYGQIPRARRVEKHCAAAAWIASLSPDRSDDRAEMLAHHYRQALTLAQAAGIDAAALRAPALAALAEASERAAALSAWMTAGDLAREALELTDDESALRPELQLRLARAKAYGEADMDLQLATAALDGFLRQGAIGPAAEAEALLNWMTFWSGDGEASRQHARRALELAADVPTSVSKARAYARAARVEAIGGDPVRAIALANELLAMAEELGREDIQSDALNSRGIATANHQGDLRGIPDLELSVELADRSKAPREMALSRNNLASVLMCNGQLREAMAGLEMSREIALRLGDPGAALWAEIAMVMNRLVQVDLSETLAAADDLELKVSTESQIYNWVQLARAWVLAIRGETERALAGLGPALARARRIGDSQALAPALGTQALALYLAGRDEEADRAANELLGSAAMTRPGHPVAHLPLLLSERGRGGDWLAAQSDAHRDSAWVIAGTAAATGDCAGAADLYAAIGVVFFEAWARLIAAERGDSLQLEPALTYFVHQGATPFVRRCEAVRSLTA
jgi:class 3 adenylate cyclase